MEPIEIVTVEILNDFTTRMEVAMKEVHSALTKAANDMVQFYDIHHREAPLYVVREKVLLNRQNLMMTCLMKKLNQKWLGPYPVEKVVSQGAYRLKLPSSIGDTHPVFLITLMWPYNADISAM